MLVAVISFIGLLASVAITVRAASASAHPLGKRDLLGIVPFALMQLFLTVWAGIGLVQNDVVSALIANIVIVACTAARIDRRIIIDRIRGAVARNTHLVNPATIGALLVIVGSVLAALALEVPSNHDITRMYPLCLLLELALVAAIECGLFFLSGRRGIAPSIISVILFIVGLIEYFIINFKAMPIQAGDLSAITTAAAVAGSGYSYTISAFCVYGIALLAMSLLATNVAGQLRGAVEIAPNKRRRYILVNVLVGILCLGGVGAHVTMIDYYNTLNIQIYTWRPLDSYYRQGFLPAFISGVQTVNPPKPDDYSVEEAQDLVKSYASQYDEQEEQDTSRAAAEEQFNTEKPTVIAIMNETFSDLSMYQMLHANYTGPTFFNSLDDCVQRGNLYVSAYGGGTCNSEFEFLTGNSMSNLGSGVYPYTIYDLTECGNLAQQFKDLGYDTTAMHPNHATNWNRENVYQDFGFDQFLSIEDFEGSDTLRNMVTDKATYEKILELLKTNDDPQFIFDVTMQNHSGYKTGLIPSDEQLNLTIDGVSDPEVNEYVSLIQQSDEALEYLISELRKIDRPVVVVFFGDHQPYFPDTYNDLWFTGEDEAIHQERLWQTDYIIWANYDLAGSAQANRTVDLSSNYLGAELMRLIGAPMSDYQKALEVLRESMPQVNVTGYSDRKGRWYLAGATAEGDEDAEAVATARDDYAKMQYFELFGDGKHIFTLHAQDAANETDPTQAPL